VRKRGRDAREEVFPVFPEDYPRAKIEANRGDRAFSPFSPFSPPRPNDLIGGLSGETGKMFEGVLK